MSTKGASNHYGNSKNGRHGKATLHIGYAWAKDFNSRTLQDHFNRTARKRDVRQRNLMLLILLSSLIM